MKYYNNNYRSYITKLIYWNLNNNKNKNVEVLILQKSNNDR